MRLIALDLELAFVDRSASTTVIFELRQHVLALRHGTGEASDNGNYFAAFSLFNSYLQALLVWSYFSFGRDFVDRFALTDFHISATAFAEYRPFQQGPVKEAHDCNPVYELESVRYVECQLLTAQCNTAFLAVRLKLRGARRDGKCDCQQWWASQRPLVPTDFWQVVQSHRA